MASARSLPCRIGRHHWATVKNPDGDLYKRCQRCGTDQGIDLSGATSGVMGMEQQAIKGLLEERNRKKKHG